MSHGQHGQRWKFTRFSIQKVARPSGTTLQLAVNSLVAMTILCVESTGGGWKWKYLVSVGLTH